MASFTSLKDETFIALDALADRTASITRPTLRLGVTGLSRAGKTVFITSLVRNLVENGRLPMFEVMREGRLVHAELTESSDGKIPRFEYEKHVDALISDRIWPDSTRSISQLRLKLDYTPRPSALQLLPRGKLNIDLIDYPGEWLLDLPLLNKSYREFCVEAIERASSPQHFSHSEDWRAEIQSINILSDASEGDIERLSDSFKHYLRSAKNDDNIISVLPPGRFLMPGDFEGAPALTFSPLPDLGYSHFPERSIAGVMERRYEAYKKHIVKPFFREHIARLDRQVILVDALQAINGGRASILEMQRALGEILSSFRTGKNNWITNLWKHKITRILVAATKADHLHHTSHDHLETITAEIVADAVKAAGYRGAATDTLALAAVRSTREGTLRKNGDELPIVIGTPMPNEVVDGLIFDGETETGIFPGDLPDTLGRLIDAPNKNLLKFVRFRPPQTFRQDAFPHIRLDRALEFLFGDYLS
ncbi:YcjX family GTP-binding protein [Bartonella sp. LJL80]